MSESAEAPEDVIPYLAADHIVKLIVSGSVPGHTSETVDPDLVLDGILMGLAMVMEQAPEFPTNSALRKGTEDFGKRLHHYAKAFRATFDETGVHVIDEVLDRFRGAPRGGSAN